MAAQQPGQRIWAIESTGGDGAGLTRFLHAHAERTHNHYAEYRQRGRNGRWRDSGVRTTQSDYWTVALPHGTAVMVPIAKMRRLVEAAVDAGDTRLMDRGDTPTVGAIVPLAKLVA